MSFKPYLICEIYFIPEVSRKQTHINQKDESRHYFTSHKINGTLEITNCIMLDSNRTTGYSASFPDFLEIILEKNSLEIPNFNFIQIPKL